MAKKAYKSKTIFLTQYRYFHYYLIFFSFFNALANLYCYINEIFVKKFNLLIIFYLDNIFIYAKNLGQSYMNNV